MSSKASEVSSSNISSFVPSWIIGNFTRKFLLTVILVMVVTAAIGGILFSGVTGTLDSQVDQQVESTAHLQANQLENWIGGFERQTRLRAESSVYQTGSSRDIQLHLSGVTLGQGVVALHYIDLQSGQIEASTTSDVQGTNFAESGVPWAMEDLTRVASETDRADNVYIADQPYESPGTDERVIAFVSSPSNNSQHALIVEPRVGSRVSNFEQTSESAYTTIHRGDRLVYSGGKSHSIPTPLQASSTNVTTVNSEVVASAQVEGTDWTLVSHVPTESAFAVRNQVSELTAVLFVLPLVLIGAVGVVLGRHTGGALQRLTGKAEKMKQGNLDVDLERQRADEIGRLTAAFDEMRDELQTQISEAESARAEAEVARAEAIEMSNHLQAQAKTYSETMQKCALGDLTQRLEYDEENDAMDRIASNFNEMIQEFEKTIGQVHSYVHEVEESGAEVEESANTVRAASEQVADSIQSIAMETEDQHERLRQLVADIDDCAEALSNAANDDFDFEAQLDDLQSVANEMDELATHSEQTQKETDTISAAAQEQAAELTTVSERANELQRYAKPLRDILNRFETEEEHEFVFSVGPTGTTSVDETDE
jgi:methyl-accepting chemotaxis protein